MDPSCATTDIYSAIGPGGQVCSGKGVCVNASCVCEGIYFGNADMFSLEGLACQNNFGIDRALWGLALLAWFRLWIQVLLMLKARLTSGRRSGLKTILFQSVFTLVMAATIALRVATGWNIGVNIPISVLFSFSLSLVSVSSWWIMHSLFVALLQGTSKLGQSDATKSLIKRAFTFGVFANVFFAFTMFGSQIGACFLPVGPSPGRIGLLIVRNMCVVAYFGSFILLDKIQLRALGQLKSSSKDRPEMASPGGSEDIFARTIGKFQENINAGLKRIVLLFLINFVFCAVPPLFVWNYIGTTIMLALSAGPNHAIHNLRAVASPVSMQVATTVNSSGSDHQGHNSMKIPTTPLKSSIKRGAAGARD